VFPTDGISTQITFKFILKFITGALAHDLVTRRFEYRPVVWRHDVVFLWLCRLSFHCVAGGNGGGGIAAGIPVVLPVRHGDGGHFGRVVVVA
jgi:hypothetical protein